MVDILKEFWLVLLDMAPWLLFGFLIAGIISEILPRQFIERHLGGKGFIPSTKASLLGIPLPICSCGIIPVAASLRHSGASRGSTTSFLLSTPQTGVDSIFVTYSMLGPLFTIYRVVAAFITGVAGGVLVDALSGKDETESELVIPDDHDPVNCNDPECKYCKKLYAEKSTCTDSCCSGNEEGRTRSVGEKLRRMLKYGFVTLPADIAKPLLIGLIISGLITSLIPEDFFSNLLGGWSWIGLPLMLVIGIPMYVCATSSVPIAAALIATGFSPGAALVFLISGPVTNGAAITTIWQVLGRRATMVYLGVVIIGSLAAGLLLDSLYKATQTPHVHHGHFMMPVWLSTASAIALIFMIAYSLWPKKKAVKELIMSADTNKMELKVDGMTCSHCQSTVERVLSEQPGVSEVQVDLAGGVAVIAGEGMDVTSMIAALKGVGFNASQKD